jgi:transcriptional antiterminator RfaH
LTEADIFDGASWHVIVARASQRERAISNLERQGFRTFSPMMAEDTDPRRKGETLRPLFGGYVFVGVGNGLTASSLRGTFGVAEVVADALGAPKRMTEPDLRALRRIHHRALEDGGAVSMTRRRAAPSYARGDLLTVGDGPFAGLAGIFQRSVAGGKVARLLLDLFGREVEAGIPMPLVGRRSSGKDLGAIV